ncbi:hypothetical protein RRG08_054230 [Elysia crispata]|uniref:Uncharacterized protein n=1 Tax=Elysia crispata TaxID=231223 RepID=A0AAE0YC54_9GAST|nr:hypothetical protein RRG08_054230 [Elysia crispata]
MNSQTKVEQLDKIQAAALRCMTEVTKETTSEAPQEATYIEPLAQTSEKARKPNALAKAFANLSNPRREI